jgi:hypothetical protein
MIQVLCRLSYWIGNGETRQTNPPGCHVTERQDIRNYNIPAETVREFRKYSAHIEYRVTVC